jgi:hypothetical protein
MTEEERKARAAEAKAEAERRAQEARDMFAPPGTHTKGGHMYPSPSGSGTPSLREVAPLGHQPTYRKLRE